jgi:tRNA(adenine34) deaminase
VTVQGQASLDGFDGQVQPTDRLFFAVMPDAPAAEQIAGLAEGLRDEFSLKGRPLQLERFHITLHHLGDYAGIRQDIVAAAVDAASKVEVPSFEVSLDRAGSLGGRAQRKPFVLRGGRGVADLVGLQQALGAALKTTILGSWVHANFTPHVTLLYDEKLVEEQPVAPVHWKVREFLLIHSLLGQTQYVVLGRWRLNVEGRAERVAGQALQDELAMRRAIDQASNAALVGEVPVGAVIMQGDQVVATGYNRPITDNDPTAHAEIVALRHAATLLGNYRLPECELFVTLEPCAMCAMALMHARFKRVVFGAADPKTGAAGSVVDLFANRQLNRHTKVEGGVLADDCGKALSEFFAERRALYKNRHGGPSADPDTAPAPAPEPSIPTGEVTELEPPPSRPL